MFNKIAKGHYFNILIGEFSLAFFKIAVLIHNIGRQKAGILFTLDEIKHINTFLFPLCNPQTLMKLNSTYGKNNAG